MVMKKLAMLAAATCFGAALGVAAPAMALPTGWYAGAGYTSYDSDDDSIGAVTGRLGYQFTPNWGVEGEASTGVDDDNGVELDSAFGIYGTAALPITERLDIFGRAGYQTTEIEGAS